MSQHDYNIANAAGAAVRTDINNALGAIVTLNAGGTAPTTMYAYMLWADTDSGLLKMRNAANSAWITIGLLAGFKLDDWFAPDDNTDLNVSNSAHGLCPKAPNDATKFLRGDGGAWAIPPTFMPATNFQSYSKTLFGDGSEGNVIITENTTLPDSGIGVRVKQYDNLTINSGIYLEGHANDKVLVILVDTLTVNGTIRMNGRGGALDGGIGAFGGGGGGWGYQGEYIAGPGGGGGCGQSGQPGQNGPTPGLGGGRNQSTYLWVPSLPFFSFVGRGGNGVDGAVGTIGINLMNSLLSPLSFETLRYLYGGGGGSGGTGSYPNNQRHGGKGGGVIWIEANSIIWGGAGLISANGETGESGISSSEGGGGGGAAGAIQLIYKTKTGSSTLQSNGGSGGAGASEAYAGGAGANGLSGEFQVE